VGGAARCGGLRRSVLLGNWQSGRADDRRAAAAQEQRLELRGEFLERYTVLLDNKVNRGRPGYHVVQPLRVADGRHVLINRGWVAAPVHRENLPQLRTPPGPQLVEGRVLDHFPRAYAHAEAKPEGRVWQNVEVATFAAWSGLKLEPYVIEHSPLADGLARTGRPRCRYREERDTRCSGRSPLSVVLFVVLSFRRERKPLA
jgi:cytochrome oxidase assembly protein ShyY1